MHGLKRAFTPSWKCICAVILLCAMLCTAAPAAHAGPLTITFWHAMRGDKEDALKELLADFERANPDIHVDAHFVGSTSIQWGNDYDSLYRGILESLANHAPPDVAQVYENWTTQLMEYDCLVPVQDYFSSIDRFTPADVADLVPVFREANTYNGKLWTLPFNKSIYVLYYNEDRFKAAGLAGPPRTWTDLRKTARALSTPDRSNYGLSLQPNVDTLGHYLYANGGDFLADNQACFNNALGVEALSYWVDLVNRDHSAFPSFDAASPFMQGKAAMYIYTTSLYARLTESLPFKVRVAIVPSGAGRNGHVQLAGTNLALFKTSPERQAAAWKLIRYLSSSDVSTKWALRTGYLPVRQSSINSADYQAWLARNPDFRNAAMANLKNGCMQPKVSAWQSIRGIIDDATFEAVSLRSTPKDALDRAVAMSNDLIKKILGGIAR